MIGYVDVQDADRVLDTKTGKQASRKVKPSWQLQGRLYAQAAEADRVPLRLPGQDPDDRDRAWSPRR